ncbi:mitochondrial import protein Pam17 [Lanmaoa asiatica]|nr:mitochondrial import protein Pam17 [Lanmaoa asiatica]
MDIGGATCPWRVASTSTFMAPLLKRSYGCGIRISATTRPAPKKTSFIRHNSSTVSGSSKDAITWPEYLDIRRGKRRWETVYCAYFPQDCYLLMLFSQALTIPSSLLGLAGGAAYFGSLETDATKPIMGIDPMFFYGACMMACTGLGYLLGPAIGSTCWRMTHRRTLALIEAKDREFYRHIVKNRVDPTAQSANNPVPDYYGEKIGSLHQYRQWLRDQAKFRRKAQFPEE